MKKVYRMADLDCANCAAKMERAISKIEGVESVSVNFLTQRMTIECSEEQLSQIMSQAQKCVSKIEPHARIIGV